jgi:Tfp pilus assembly protein PilF
MSLLIKALEQAAKDRTSPRADGERASAVGKSSNAAREPTLEPVPAPRLVSSFDESAVRTAAVNAPEPGGTVRSATPLGFEKPRSQRSSTPATSPTTHLEDAQPFGAEGPAGAREAGARVLARLRRHPIAMLAAVAVLGIGSGIYAYLQISTPDMSPTSGTARAQPTAAPAAPPVADPPRAAAQTTAQTPAATSPPTTSALESIPARLSADAQPAGASAHVDTPVVPAAPQSDALSAPETRSARKPILTSSVVATAGEPDAAAAVSPDRRPERAARKSTAAQRAAPTAPRPSASNETREQIAVSPANSQARVNPHVSEGYALLQVGNLDAARSTYSRAIETEPLNIDALLGLAYIALQEHRSDEAVKTYLRILQLNPRHAVAQAALIALMGRADPNASETRLKQLVSREPSAFLHFVLGNLYSDQSLWNQAQRSYFQAHQLEPDNADYAYNLAVGLDHLRQNKLALEFYRRAEDLARSKGGSNFDVSNARQRIHSLSSQLE